MDSDSDKTLLDNTYKWLNTTQKHMIIHSANKVGGLNVVNR